MIHQLIKDVPLMNMDGDECFKLGSLHFGQVPGGLSNQLIQKFQERLVGGHHDFAIKLGILQGFGCISSPDHLYSQQSNLTTQGSMLRYTIQQKIKQDQMQTNQR